MQISGYGITVSLPTGWSAQLSDKSAIDGEPMARVLQAANFDLPPAVATFGGVLMESMKIGDVFIALVETGASELAYKGLYAKSSLPKSLEPSDLVASAMPASFEGLYGYQYYCTLSGRPFCLFVVASCSEASGGASLDDINSFVASITVAAAAA